MAHLWIRDEIKEGERRTAIPPAFAKQLLDAGFHITVERSKNRAFSDKEFE